MARLFWPEHPDVLRAEILIGVTQAASRRTGLTSSTADQVKSLAAIAPLAPEPFAVTGAMALRQREYRQAEQRLMDARRRDPRFEATRMLLAQTYLVQEKVVPGLKELVSLSQISPAVMPGITAALAAYSHAPGAVSRLQQALRGNPSLENALLAYLAADPRNAQLILSLVSGEHRGNTLSQWQQKLLSSLVSSGDAANALRLWHEFTGRGTPDLGDFSNSVIQSPFTWTLRTSSAGSATAHGQRLDVQFFGETDNSLASTTLILAPGQYQIGFRVSGASSDKPSVHLLLVCVPSGAKLLDVAVVPRTGASGARFEVPAGCAAQTLNLMGFAQVFPTEAAFSISDVQVHKLA